MPQGGRSLSRIVVWRKSSICRNGISPWSCFPQTTLIRLRHLLPLPRAKEYASSSAAFSANTAIRRTSFFPHPACGHLLPSDGRRACKRFWNRRNCCAWIGPEINSSWVTTRFCCRPNPSCRALATRPRGRNSQRSLPMPSMGWCSQCCSTVRIVCPPTAIHRGS